MNCRLLVTKKCSRGCDGCCNENADVKLSMKPIFDLSELLKYDSITLTGGEPLEQEGLTSKIISDLRLMGYTGKFYLYTSIITFELKKC